MTSKWVVKGELARRSGRDGLCVAVGRAKASCQADELEQWKTEEKGVRQELRKAQKWLREWVGDITRGKLKEKRILISDPEYDFGEWKMRKRVSF